MDAQAAAIARAAADPDRMIRRAYSIASESRADEYLEFYLTVVHERRADAATLQPQAQGSGVRGAEGGRRLHARQGRAGQAHPDDRHGHRPGALHVDAAQRAGLQRAAQVRGRPRRALLVGPGLSDRADRPGPPLPQLPLHSGHHATGRKTSPGGAGAAISRTSSPRTRSRRRRACRSRPTTSTSSCAATPA